MSNTEVDAADTVQDESKPITDTPNGNKEGESDVVDSSKLETITSPTEQPETSTAAAPAAPPPSLEETHSSTGTDTVAPQSEEEAPVKQETQELSAQDAPKSEPEAIQIEIVPSYGEPPPPPPSTETAEDSTLIEEPQPQDVGEMLDNAASLEEEEGESVPQSPEQMAIDILYDIIGETLKSHEEISKEDALYVELSENDQLTAFIEDTLGALADDISMGEREYISHDETYFWMTYFFLQFCGFRIFLSNIDAAIEHGQNLKEVAEIVVEIVDNVCENAAYLHWDSDVPEHVAKSIIWQILNSRLMLRRYDDRGVAYWQAEDILDEIIDKVTSRPPTAKPKPPPTALPRKSMAVHDKQIPQEPMVCREFGGIFNVAEDFVEALIEDSKKIIGKKLITRATLAKPFTASMKKVARFVSDYKSFPMLLAQQRHQLYYPRIKDFNTEVGKKIITTMVNKWKKSELKEDWGYSVKFLMGQSDACSDFYIYEAKFGLPTPLYPVPQATCSVLFTIEVSRVKPPVCPVNVSYKLEGSGLAIIPEEHQFQEAWLINVIEGKLALYRRLRF